MKLLLADTDHDLVEMLSGWLKTLGYEIYRAFSEEQAKIIWDDQQPDLVVIDTSFSDGDGMTVCCEMRRKHDALVLMITNGRDVQEEVRCLETGADDFLRKPFFPSQLLARIRALSRRTRSTLQRRPSSIITVGPICVDSLHNEVTIHGKTSRLTPTESKMLHVLAINANDVCTASQIITHVWGYDGEGDTCLIKAHIRHLRQKIEPDPSRPHYILTVPGVGYSLMHYTGDEQEAWASLDALPVAL